MIDEFRFFQAAKLREQFSLALDVLTSERQTASQRGRTECCRSGLCCWHCPGELSSDDVRRLSEHLKLSPQAFFRQYTVVDLLDGKYRLRLRRADVLGGRMMPWRETYSMSAPCVFLRQDGDAASCTVHEAKPAVCAGYGCWKPKSEQPTSSPTWTREDLLALGWDGVNPDEV